MQTKRKRRKYIILGSILLVLIIVRLLLPYIVLRYANKALAHMDGYYGHVRDIDIALYRGAYQLNDIYINKLDSATGKQAEFFSSRVVDLSIAWRPLFHGSLVGNAVFRSPKIVFTKEKVKITEVAKDTAQFKQIKKELMPLKVNRLEVIDGSIHYTDSNIHPVLDVSLDHAHVLATNLRNTTDDQQKLPSALTAQADIYEGSLTLGMKLDALARQPTFDLTAEIRDANLAKLNNFFKAYGRFDVSKGTMGLYTEFAADKGKFVGYVKPLIKDLKVKGPEDKDDPLVQKVKEDIFHVAGRIFTNPNHHTLATKVPIEGEFTHPDIDNWEAVWEILKNAFIEALMPSVDNEININTVRKVDEEEEKPGLFKRLFGGRKDHKKKEGLERYKTSDPRK